MKIAIEEIHLGLFVLLLKEKVVVARSNSCCWYFFRGAWAQSFRFRRLPSCDFTQWFMQIVILFELLYLDWPRFIFSGGVSGVGPSIVGKTGQRFSSGGSNILMLLRHRAQ